MKGLLSFTESPSSTTDMSQYSKKSSIYSTRKINMHSLKNWIEEMQVSEIGKSTLVNMLYDIQQNRLSEDVLRSFFRDLSELWNMNQEETHITVGINEQILSSLFDNAKSMYFSKGRVIAEDSISCSRTMNALSFLEHNWNKRKSPFDITGQPFSEREVKKLEGADLAKIGKGEMRTNYNFTSETQAARKIWQLLFETSLDFTMKEKSAC
jgi:hypothetical protein